VLKAFNLELETDADTKDISSGNMTTKNCTLICVLGIETLKFYYGKCLFNDWWRKRKEWNVITAKVDGFWRETMLQMLTTHTYTEYSRTFSFKMT